MPDLTQNARRARLPHDKGLLVCLASLPATGTVALVICMTYDRPHIPRLVAVVCILLAASIGGCVAGMSYGRWQVYASRQPVLPRPPDNAQGVGHEPSR